MNRRGFLVGTGAAISGQAVSQSEVTIERPVSGQPYRGKVLALITPHLDDGPIFAGGTLSKLLREGYSGYFIRTSNDEKDSYKLTLGETVLANERDTRNFVETAGLKGTFDLSYRNHRMDDVARTELRGRLIFLFRLLQVDTVLSYDPWGHYEENPDHYVTAQAVEAACWMASGNLDLPEHFAAGLKPHAVSERYYFARGPQLVNRIVDIGPTLAAKVAAIRSCKTMVEHMMKDLNDSLLERKLPRLNPNEFIKAAFVERDKMIGIQHGLEIRGGVSLFGPDRSLEQYVQQNAIPL